jgi:hypothetical protein
MHNTILINWSSQLVNLACDLGMCLFYSFFLCGCVCVKINYRKLLYVDCSAVFICFTLQTLNWENANLMSKYIHMSCNMSGDGNKSKCAYSLICDVFWSERNNYISITVPGDLDISSDTNLKALLSSIRCRSHLIISTKWLKDALSL